MDTSLTSQCASYLWALVQPHKVMKEFVESHFRNHGAVTPVIVLHILKTCVMHVSMRSQIKRLEGRLAALEKAKGKK
jgi:hypothetical protein